MSALQAWEGLSAFCQRQLCSLNSLFYVVVYTTEKIVLFYISGKRRIYMKTWSSLKVALSEMLWHYQQIWQISFSLSFGPAGNLG